MLLSCAEARPNQSQKEQVLEEMKKSVIFPNVVAMSPRVPKTSVATPKTIICFRRNRAVRKAEESPSRNTKATLA